MNSSWMSGAARSIALGAWRARRVAAAPRLAGWCLSAFVIGACSSESVEGSGGAGGGTAASTTTTGVGTTTASTTAASTTTTSVGTTTSSTVATSTATGTGSGGAGGGPACSTPDECPGVDTFCLTRTCDAGACGVAPTAEGTALPDQVTGDCLSAVCDGEGAVGQVPEDADLPDDQLACTLDACAEGVPSNEPVSAGAVCDGGLCDGRGACVECLTGDDCDTGVCALGLCVPASCTDEVQNADETDVDCGGPDCAGCALDAACLDGADCRSGRCTTGACAPVLLFSEVRTRGSAGAADEFIELYNPLDEPVVLDATWEVWARGAANVGSCANSPVVRASGQGQVVPAHGHVLLGVSPGYDDAVPADGTYPSQFNDTGNLILRHLGDDIDALCFSIDATTLARLQDPSCNYTCEGTPVSNLPHDNTAAGDSDVSLERRPGGAAGNGQDAGDNAADFQMVASSPQNTASPTTP